MARLIHIFALIPSLFIPSLFMFKPYLTVKVSFPDVRSLTYIANGAGSGRHVVEQRLQLAHKDLRISTRTRTLALLRILFIQSASHPRALDGSRSAAHFRGRPWER